MPSLISSNCFWYLNFWKSLWLTSNAFVQNFNASNIWFSGAKCLKATLKGGYSPQSFLPLKGWHQTLNSKHSQHQPLILQHSFWHILLGIWMARVWFLGPRMWVQGRVLPDEPPIQQNPPPHWWPQWQGFIKGWHKATVEHYALAWPIQALCMDPTSN